MKLVTVSCDECGKLIPEDDRGNRGFVALEMKTSGYGMQDGYHCHSWDICSSECGLKLLSKELARIVARK